MCVCMGVRVCPDLDSQVQEVFDNSDLSTGGRRVERSVSPFVLTADLRPLTHQQTHHI